jgi:hypothetical protein
MCDTTARLEKQSGLSHDAFENSFDAKWRFTGRNPATGEKIPLGNFGPKGEFIPAIGGDANAFNSAIVVAQLDANNYKDATDRVVNFVTTSIVVIAAIVSTAATFGAAASIWIPVLVTAGAGLIGMGASWAIKGGRYGRDEMLHDLAMTVVQAATAGLGAAAGVALKGGMPALRLAAGALKVEKAALAAARATQAVVNAGKIAAAEEAAIVAGRMAEGTAEQAARRTALIAAGRTAEGTAEEAAKRSAILSLGNSLSLGKEMAIGAGSSAFAGGATAALDADAWREGKYASGILHGIGGGLLGGGAGAAAAHLGASAVSGLASAGRAALGIEKLAEGEQAHWLIRGATRVAGSASAGFGQSVTEGAYRAAAQGRDINLGELVSEGGWAAVQNAAQSVGEHGAEEHLAIKEERTATRAAAARPIVEPEPNRRIGPAGESGSAANLEALAAPVRAAAKEAGPPPAALPGTPRLPGDPTAAPRRKPPALPPEALRGGAKQRIETIEFMEPGWGVMSGNPTARREAAQIYRRLIEDQPHLEVGVYRNTKTGEYVTFQGNAEEVHVGVGASGETEGPHPEGDVQRWKEILSKDEGDWELQAHYHPVAKPGEITTEHWRRLPSAEDGDFHVMEGESHNRDIPAARESILHYYADGVLEHVRFGYDPHSTDARYWVDIPGPTPGSRIRHPFADLAEYRKFFTAHTGETLAAPSPAAGPSPSTPPSIGRVAGAPGAPGEVFERLTGGSPNTERGPGPAMAGQPGEIEMLHGTHSTAAASIREQGIELSAIQHEHQDFGRALYLTLDEANANLYATEKASTPRAIERGDRPEVMRFRFRLEDLGDIVDVRPGGEHRARWEEFLRRTPPDPVLGFAVPPDFMAARGGEPLWRTAFDYLSTYGGEQRGVVFQRFLEHIGMAHAPVVRGDLGGVLTSGRVAPGGGEQIAIRTQEAADKLSAALHQAAAETPVSAAPVPQSAAPTETGEAGHTATDREPPAGGQPHTSAEQDLAIAMQRASAAEAPGATPPAAATAATKTEAETTGITGTEIEQAPARRDREQGHQPRDPKAAGRVEGVVEQAQRRLREITEGYDMARARPMSSKEAFDYLQSIKPPAPAEIVERLHKSRAVFEREVERQREPGTKDTAEKKAERKIDVATKQSEKVKEWLNDPSLSPEARKYLEWQALALSHQLGQEEATGTVRAAPQAQIEAIKIEIPKAEAVQREATRTVKELLETRSDNYKSIKENATFDEIMGKERFNDLNKLRAAEGLPPLQLNPDHIVPLDKIANLPELRPVLALYERASPTLRDKLDDFLIRLGDLRENLIPMEASANQHLKGSLDWDQISVVSALAYGYNGGDFKKMILEQAKAHAKILETIEAALKELQEELTTPPSNTRRANTRSSSGG